jgi:hypothetical protein
MDLAPSEDTVELGVGREGEDIEASSLVPLLEDEYPTSLAGSTEIMGLLHKNVRG